MFESRTVAPPFVLMIDDPSRGICPFKQEETLAKSSRVLPFLATGQLRRRSDRGRAGREDFLSLPGDLVWRWRLAQLDLDPAELDSSQDINIAPSTWRHTLRRGRAEVTEGRKLN